MDYRTFIERLPSLYENWGQATVQPKSSQFRGALQQMRGFTTANVTQLLNFAVACMEADEVYCEIGCFQGATLVGALLNQPGRVAYAVDNFSEFDPWGKNRECLMANLAAFDLQEQVFFCEQDFEVFFADLKTLQTSDRVGVYLYDGAHDYRSQLMGLLLVKPFLAERALIIIDDSNWDGVQQANWDFIAAHPQCRLLLDLPTPSNGHPSFWNGLQLLVWDAQTSHHPSWSILTQVRKPAVIQAIQQLSEVYEQPAPIALVTQPTETLEATEQRCLAILQQDEAQAIVWHELGVTWYLMQRYDEAQTAISQALALEPTVATYHYSLGLVLTAMAEWVSAAQAYQRAVTLDAHYTDAYNNLGNLVAEHGDPQQAEKIYQQAIAHNPDSAGTYLNLGNILLVQKKVEAAIAAYETALTLDPKNQDTMNNLAFARELAQDDTQACLFAGNSLFQRHRHHDAAGHYQMLVDRQQADLEIYTSLAHCYEKTHQYDALITLCRQGIALFPTASHLHIHLIRVLQATNQTTAAIAQATQSAQQFPDNVWFKMQQHLLLPVLYETEAAIADDRQRFSEGLDTLIRETVLTDPTVQKAALSAISQHTNFFLAYQNGNDLELQKRYGQWVHQIMAANYPQWVEPRSLPPVTGKIRIGYVSGCLRDHTIGKLILGWFRHHNREQFQIHAYHLFDIDDALSQTFRQHCDAFHQIPDQLEAACKQILADQPHILVFPEIGMQPIMTQLAALRLAPVQCASWVHPVTSGLPTIDYFLSSDLMEPDHANQHYGEALIRLPKIGIAFAKPDVPAPTLGRAAFQLREDAVVYLACQSLFKYPPSQDRVFAAIARRVPNAQFVFINRPNAAVADQFQARLQRAFAAVDLDSQQFCVMLPSQTQTEYWNLNQVSDVFLDSFGWSGGHTTLEAIACGLMIVTCPGEFMRGRHSDAILKMLGITETIAQTEAEYIEIAVRLGIDPHWRSHVVHRMTDRHHYLYDDPTCVRALEGFYQQAVKRLQG